jgi:hypothetical protein
MKHVTLILTRKSQDASDPVEDFGSLSSSGRWGRMAVVEGPQVLSAHVSFFFADAKKKNEMGLVEAVIQKPGAHRTETIQLANRSVHLRVSGDDISNVTEFDTMERFKHEGGKGYYMQVRPSPLKPYGLTMDYADVVAKLNKTGECLRVHGHGYKQQGTNVTAGILIHEAPHVNWLIGCIAPRVLGHKVLKSHDRTPSTKAMEHIFKAMGGFRKGKSASLIVLDW